MKNRKIRYAVVGLGHIAQTAVLPGFKHARKNSELVALVSEDEAKLTELGDLYGVQTRLHPSDYESLLASGQIDAVYLATPNINHRDFAVSAARHQVHVLCEKPLAVEESDCLAMIAACEKHKVKLMTAYRLHFDEANLRALQIAQSGKLGDLRIFNSVFAQQVKDKENIRLSSARGGGSLLDMGVYCINAARFLFQAQPTEVFAWGASSLDARFAQVNEMVTACLRFPGERMAQFTTSFGGAGVASYDLIGTKGSLRLEDCYEYAGPMHLKTKIGDKEESEVYPERDQFAGELLYFSDCILRDQAVEPSGEEGLIDVQIVQALFQSLKEKKPVSLQTARKSTSMLNNPVMKKPKILRPKDFHATAPDGGKQ